MRLTLPTALIMGLFSQFNEAGYAGVIYSTGFENPPFALGQLAGQNGWIDFGNATHIAVENTFAHTGSQAVQFTTSGASGQMGSVHPDNVNASNLIISVTADLNRQDSGTFSGAADLAAFDGSGTDIGFMRWASNDALMIIGGDGTTTIASALTKNAWDTFTLRFNFGTRHFDALLNSVLVAGNKTFLGSSTSTTFQDGGIFVQAPGTDNIFFDNYSTVSATAIPEPDSLLLVSLGTALLTARLRRKARTAQR